MKSHIGQKRAAWWFTHVAQWRQSDMSKAGYCAKHSLNLSSFRYWLRKSSTATMDASTAIVPLPFTLVPKLSSISLLVGNRYALDIPADFDEAALARLLSVLESRC